MLIRDALLITCGVLLVLFLPRPPRRTPPCASPVADAPVRAAWNLPYEPSLN